MNNRRYSLFFLIIIGTIQVLAAESCDVPVWNKGDTWIWRVTEPGIGESREIFLSEEAETNLLTSIVQGKEWIGGVECYHDYETYDGHPESEYHSYYLVSCPPTEHHGIQYDTATGKPVMKSTIYPGNYIVQFPLSLGKTWNAPYTFIEWTYDESTGLWDQTSEIFVEIEAEVTALEDVTVPAGTFRSYKIEVMYYTFKKVQSEIWYSPEVKNTVKGNAAVIEDKVPQPYYAFELVEYRLAHSFRFKMISGSFLMLAVIIAFITYIYKNKKKHTHHQTNTREEMIP